MIYIIYKIEKRGQRFLVSVINVNYWLLVHIIYFRWRKYIYIYNTISGSPEGKNLHSRVTYLELCFHFILFLSQNSETRIRYHICLEVRMKEFAVCKYVEVATGKQNAQGQGWIPIAIANRDVLGEKYPREAHL